MKLAQKRGKDREKLREVIVLPMEGKPLPPRCKDHPLGGDSHIEPDWLLIYKIDGGDLHLIPTGTHSDLF